MAKIRSLAPSTQRVGAHATEVDCEFAVVADGSGEPLVHLSTFGSDARASNRKSSQSMQVDRAIAEQLVEMLTDIFDLRSVAVPQAAEQTEGISHQPVISVDVDEPPIDRRVQAVLDTPGFQDRYNTYRPRFAPRSIALVLSALTGAGGRITLNRLGSLLGIRPARARQSAAVLEQVINDDGLAILATADGELVLNVPMLFEHYGVR
ncbi:hypothetical protein GCM10007304_11550 [Rhodococcoides trifolii]|uniref:Alkaline phosphatase-like protein PglZ C-terminal domain-containing protein n=1 Tax=Rhodococcoides trifolii TaxID=908250 RepID=A0A917CVP9_9NOCA|nr:hypothetical protein [Rhodococcus trifolii]GGF99376.1 hypothetical protein GCM10007304_11550 [Rhodococcus trifolii]